jgi:hypothetical protein
MMISLYFTKLQFFFFFFFLLLFFFRITMRLILAETGRELDIGDISSVDAYSNKATT